MSRQLLTILYVADLGRATNFYDRAFRWPKTVDEPVYVEYGITGGARLGLMPQANTKGFLPPELAEKRPVDGCPRAEIYVTVDNFLECTERLHSLGAICTSEEQLRDWGDRVAYFLDRDGYVVAVAEPASA
jgi:predicted enzyme related to lactoylglutathione lyase